MNFISFLLSFIGIGDRVIAFFDSSSLSRGKEKISGSNAFYPGVIGETLRSQNNNRYSKIPFSMRLTN